MPTLVLASEGYQKLELMQGREGPSPGGTLGSLGRRSNDEVGAEMAKQASPELMEQRGRGRKEGGRGSWRSNGSGGRHRWIHRCRS